MSHPTPPQLPPELANHPKLRITGELGRGGMGVVYQGTHVLMERPVAVKVIDPGVIDHPQALERFYAEVRAAAKLDHPNIVRAYDAEQAGGLCLLVMELVEGTSLEKWRRRKGGVPVAVACRCVQQAALGLQHAFEQGMVHRDLKPQNLMISARHRQVKILDFGLARLASERGRKQLTQERTFMGTPEYVAPEQATDAASADIRADIYSLGCTLYCLLAGHPPFVRDSVLETLVAHLEEDPPPLPGLPDGLWDVVARMLAKNPADRYPTPAEVVRALQPFAIESHPKPPRTIPATEPDWPAAPGSAFAPRPIARGASGWLAVGIAVAAVGVVGLGVWLATRGGAEGKLPQTRPVAKAGGGKAVAPAAENAPARPWVSILPDRDAVTKTPWAAVVDGAVRVSDPDAKSNGFTAGSRRARNAAIRARVKRLDGESVGLILRGNDQTGSYGAYYNGGEFGVGRTVVANGQLTFTHLQRKQVQRPPNDFVEFLFRVEGEWLTVEADGEEVLRVRDDWITTAGYLKFHSWRGTGLFEKVEVQILD